MLCTSIGTIRSIPSAHVEMETSWKLLSAIAGNSVRGRQGGFALLMPSRRVEGVTADRAVARVRGLHRHVRGTDPVTGRRTRPTTPTCCAGCT